MEQVLDMFFPNTESETKIDYVHVKNNGVKILIFTYHMTDDEFMVKVEEINRTNEYPGSIILENFELFVREGIKKSYKICLTDASRIEKNGFKFPLSTMYILVHGHSWYNSKGYHSRAHSREKIRWDQFRKTKPSFDDQNIIDVWYEKFNTDINDMTISLICSLILTNLKNKKDNKYLEIYSLIITAFKKEIIYTSFLTKEVNL